MILYFGLDGDGIGRIVESMMIENDLESLAVFSQKIVTAIEVIRDEAIKMGGEVVFCTGDSILFYGEIEPQFGQDIVKIFKDLTGRSASAGVGHQISDTYLGLKLAKSKGGDQMIYRSV